MIQRLIINNKSAI